MKNLRLGTKIALAIIPISLVALLVGGLLVRNALDLADQDERASVAAEVAANAMDAFEAFLEEQEVSQEIALGVEGDLDSRRAATNSALDGLSDSVTELIPLAAGPAADIVTGIFTDSSRARSLVDTIRGQDPTSPEADEAVNSVGRRLISVVTGASFYLGDESRVREGEGAVALGRAALASFQQETLIKLNEAGISELDDEALAQELQVLEWTVEDWVQTASDSSPAVRALGFTRTLLAEPGQEFTSDRFSLSRHEEFVDAAATTLRTVSESAATEAATAIGRAGGIAAIVLGALALAALAAFALGRSTTNRVRSVTSAAHQVAEVDLPKMVDSLSNPKGELETTTLEDLDETGKDEVSDLARSFSTLHGTLVQVANQQMETLRKGVSEIFVTLARRNRSLVDRQLALVDQLESREEDPEILDGYYKLDHLATRMRRNAESLLVLAGAESPRMWSEPVEMGDVVRAAIGEVDEYKRIDVLAVEPSLLSGKVVTDVSHLLAELLDNATQYSPPNERVRVTGLFDDDGYVVIVADSGVGISAEKRNDLNDLIENPPVIGLALEPTLGMYVVAGLSKRNGIKVRIVEGAPGTTVRVTIPRKLLETTRDRAPVQPRQTDTETIDGSPVAADDSPAVESKKPTSEPDIAAVKQGTTAREDSVDDAAEEPTGNGRLFRPALSPFQLSSDSTGSNGKSGSPEEKSQQVEDSPARQAIEELRAAVETPDDEESSRKAGESSPFAKDSDSDASGTPTRAIPPSPTPERKPDIPPTTGPIGSTGSSGAPSQPKQSVSSDDPNPATPTPAKPKQTGSEPAQPKPAGAAPKQTGSEPAQPKPAGAAPKQTASEPAQPKPAGAAPKHFKPAPTPNEPGGLKPKPINPKHVKPESAEIEQTQPKPTRPAGTPASAPQARQDQQRDSLPTRKPGISFRETNQEQASSAASRAGALGIRDALDGYRQGRDFAAKETEQTGDNETNSDHEDTK